MRRDVRREEREGVVGDREIRERRVIVYLEIGFDGEGREEWDLR